MADGAHRERVERAHDLPATVVALRGDRFRPKTRDEPYQIVLKGGRCGPADVRGKRERAQQMLEGEGAHREVTLIR